MKKTCIPYLMVIVGLCPTFFAASQSNIFYDSITSIPGYTYIEKALMDEQQGYLYAAGEVFPDSMSFALPVIIKMDTLGNAVWTATDQNNAERYWEKTAGVFDLIKSGKLVFATMELRNYSWGPVYPSELWCVADSTGFLQWKRPFKNANIVQLVDYDENYLIVISMDNGSKPDPRKVYYNLVQKNDGSILFTSIIKCDGYPLRSGAGVYVDQQKNILINAADTCRKYRGNRLEELIWASSYFSPRAYATLPNSFIQQDGGRYIFIGECFARAVDTLTGNTIWSKDIKPGYIPSIQNGTYGCAARDYKIRDSLLYITWESRYVGSSTNLSKGFTLTQLNKNTGEIKYNVAYDFKGVPPDPANNFSDTWDWPARICLDENSDVYMTGSYDGSDYYQGNWGVMKLNGKTGEKIYEATITNDSARRSIDVQVSPRCLNYLNGKFYCLGRLPLTWGSQTMKATLVSFGTTNNYQEFMRKQISGTIRYSSSLEAIAPYGTDKILLLKRLGRKAVLEMRDKNDELIWSQSQSTANSFLLPQHLFVLRDKSIAASMISYLSFEGWPFIKIWPGFLKFVQYDSLGNLLFQHQIQLNTSDSLKPAGIYTDTTGVVNFIYNRKRLDYNTNQTYFSGYTLGGTAPDLGILNRVDDYFINMPSLPLTGIQHYRGDTVIGYNNSFNTFKSAVQSPVNSEYFNYTGTIIPKFGMLYSSVKLDSNSYFVMGRNTNGKITGRKYRQAGIAAVLVWERELSVAGSMYNADTSALSIYAISKKDDGHVLLTKINKQTGTVGWSTEKIPANGSKIYPLDAKLSRTDNSLSVGGYMEDSTAAIIRKRYFYWVLDSSGNTLLDISVPADGLGETRVNAVANLRDGTRIFGGSLENNRLGVVGFYDDADRLSVPCINHYNYWIGTVDHAWNNAANWSCGTVPDTDSKVVIASGSVVVDSSSSIYSLTVMPGASLHVAAAVVLTVLH